MLALQGNLPCDFLASRSTFRGSGTTGDGARHWFGLGKMGPRKGASSNPGSLFYARQSIVTASPAGDSGGGQVVPLTEKSLLTTAPLPAGRGNLKHGLLSDRLGVLLPQIRFSKHDPCPDLATRLKIFGARYIRRNRFSHVRKVRYNDQIQRIWSLSELQTIWVDPIMSEADTRALREAVPARIDLRLFDY